MKEQSLGSSLERLFLGYAISLAVNLMSMVGMTGTVAGLLSIAGLVITIMALDKLRMWHPGYGRAFQFEIILIVFAVVSTVLIMVSSLVPFLLGLVFPLISIGSVALNYLVVRNVSLSTADLAGDAGDLNTAALGAMVNKLYLACCVVSAACTLLGLIPVLGTDFVLLGKLAGLASVVGVALMVYFLYRAKNSLS